MKRILTGLALLLAMGWMVGESSGQAKPAPSSDAPASKTDAKKTEAKLGDGKDAPKTFKRGAVRSPQYALNKAIKFKALHATPPQYVNIPTYLNMWGNDQYGDCTGAETFFARSASAGLKGTYDEAVTFGQQAGILNGGIISDVLDFEASNGTIIGGQTYKSGPKQSVDFTNVTTLFSAITQGAIKIGIDSSCLPSGAGNQQGWMVLNAPPSSNYDHCMSLTGCGTMSYLAGKMGVSLPAGYDGNTLGVLAYTWATIGLIDLPSLQNVVCEAWLRTPTTIGFAPPSSSLTVTIPAVTATIGTPVTFAPAIAGGTTPYTQAWTYGDNTTGTSPTHTYAAAGTLTASVTVTDSSSPPLTATATAVVTVSQTPQPPNGVGFTGSVTYTYVNGVITNVTTTAGKPDALPLLRAELQAAGLNINVIGDVIQLITDLKNKAGIQAILADVLKIMADLGVGEDVKKSQLVKPSETAYSGRRGEFTLSP